MWHEGTGFGHVELHIITLDTTVGGTDLLNRRAPANPRANRAEWFQLHVHPGYGPAGRWRGVDGVISSDAGQSFRVSVITAAHAVSRNGNRREFYAGSRFPASALCPA
jgi:hypothetical protein